MKQCFQGEVFAFAFVSSNFPYLTILFDQTGFYKVKCDLFIFRKMNLIVIHTSTTLAKSKVSFQSTQIHFLKDEKF